MTSNDLEYVFYFSRKKKHGLTFDEEDGNPEYERHREVDKYSNGYKPQLRDKGAFITALGYALNSLFSLDYMTKTFISHMSIVITRQ